MQHPLHAPKWAKDLFGLSTLIDLKRSNLGDPNWSERSVGVLWEVEGRGFPSATNRYTPFVFILTFHNSSRMPYFMLWKSEYVTYPPVIWYLSKETLEHPMHVNTLLNSV